MLETNLSILRGNFLREWVGMVLCSKTAVWFGGGHGFFLNDYEELHGRDTPSMWYFGGTACCIAWLRE